MDNLTHTLTGLMLARAGLNRVFPKATWLVPIAINTPDIDVAWSMTGPSHNYIDHHRGFTHSLLFLPLMAVAAALLFGVIDRVLRTILRALPFTRNATDAPLPWAQSLTQALNIRGIALGALGVVTHILQDTTNVYGIRSLWPASDHWFRLDWVNVVDPWIWAMLLAGVLFPWFSSLVSGEIGAKKTRGAGMARMVLVLLVLYVAARGVLHSRALDTLRAYSFPGGPTKSLSALPSASNPFAWTGVVESRTTWRMLAMNLNAELNPESGRLIEKGTPNPAAAQTEAFRPFLYFAQFPYWTTNADPDGKGNQIIEACDLRFGAPGEHNFCASALADPTGRILDAQFLLNRFRAGQRALGRN